MEEVALADEEELVAMTAAVAVAVALEEKNYLVFTRVENEALPLHLNSNSFFFSFVQNTLNQSIFVPQLHGMF